MMNSFLRNKKIAGMICLLCSILLISGCKKQLKAPEGYSIYTAQSKPLVNELFFSSTVQPLKSVMIASPVEGIVENKYFEYGQAIKAGSVLFTLQSNQLEKEYRDALASFLKSKEQYENNRTKLQEDEELHKAGIISTNEYHASQTSFNDSYLGYVQADQALQQTLEKAHAKVEETKKIMMSDREAVNKALLAKFDVVNITSTAEGVALLPEKTEGESGAPPRLVVGSQVKTGQALVLIGDMNGISLTVAVNQVDVNSIKSGQKAIITSDGFPGIVLHGVVTDVSAQAVTATGGGLPTFPVRVEIKNIPEVDRKKIAVGMTAMVKIMVEHEAVIMIPIKAVDVHGAVSTVKMFDRKTNKVIQMPVTTGQTSLQEVEIVKGLIAGDHVLVRKS